MYRETLGRASCILFVSVAEFRVNGAACQIAASNPIPGFLPRSWGSRSYKLGKLEHGRGEAHGETGIEAGGHVEGRSPTCAAHGAASRPGAGEREQWSGDGVGRRPQAMASCMKTGRLSWQVRKALEGWLSSGSAMTPWRRGPMSRTGISETASTRFGQPSGRTQGAGREALQGEAAGGAEAGAVGGGNGRSGRAGDCRVTQGVCGVQGRGEHRDCVDQDHRQETRVGAGDRHHRGARADVAPATYSWDWSDRREQVWQRGQSLADAWAQRNRTLLRRWLRPRFHLWTVAELMRRRRCLRRSVVIGNVAVRFGASVSSSSAVTLIALPP